MEEGKTTSLTKIETNRKNAKKSTGPKDASLTRLNALRHGILSKEVIIKGEEKKVLEELGEKLRSELSPQGELENIFIDRIVSSIWRLRRALKVEKESMEWAYTEEIESDYNLSYQSSEQTQRQAYRNMIASDHTEKIIRYETTIERQIYRALHELMRLQSARRGEKPALPVAIDVDVSDGS